MNNGSKIRVFNLLSQLSKYYQIILLSFSDSPSNAPIPQEIRSLCEEIYTIPFRQFNPNSFKSIIGHLSFTPRSILDTYSSEMASCIRKIVKNSNPDVIIASTLGTAIYFKNFSGIPSLFEEVEVGLIYELHLKAVSKRERFRNWLTWWKLSRFLGKVLRNFASCTVVSEKEKELLQRIIPGYKNIDVISNCINAADYQGISEISQPESLIFTGSFRYEPNYEAMIWFINNVLPIIQLKIPKINLTITGDHADLPLPQSSNIHLTGFVEDIKPLISRSWISIAPLISGGGTRLKILEAMGLGVPVITTSKGAEGLDVTHGENILITDNPHQFAEYVIQLINDPQLRQSIIINAEQLVKNRYDWPVIMPKFLNVIERIS